MRPPRLLWRRRGTLQHQRLCQQGEARQILDIAGSLGDDKLRQVHIQDQSLGHQQQRGGESKKGDWAVEFRRRAKDCVAFNYVYRQAARHLNLVFQTGGGGHGRADCATMPCPFLSPGDAVDDQLGSFPAPLDAAASGHRELQVDAVAGLAALVTRHGYLAHKLLARESLHALMSIVISLCGTDVEYPMVVVFECLARIPGASSILVAAGLTQMLLCKALAKTTHPFIAELLHANVLGPLAVKTRDLSPHAARGASPSPPLSRSTSPDEPGRGFVTVDVTEKD